MRRTICFALALILTVSLLPLSVFAAETAPQTAAAMTTDVSAFTADANTDAAATVWYGGSAWRVIGYDGEGVASEDGAATLLAKSSIDYSSYSYGDTDYGPSILKSRIDNIEASFSPAESAALRSRLLTEKNDEIAGDEVNVEMWPLSVSEAEALNESIAALDPENWYWAINCWWLRTPGNDGGIAAVFGNGAVQSGGLDVYRMSGEEIGVRPAFRLDCESVLFVSRAEGGKKGEGALAEVGEYDGSEWKLTLLDADHSGFTASYDSASGDVWTIKYGLAAAGVNEYISAVIVDGDGAITYYGRLCKAEAGSDKTATVDVSGKMNEGDKLYVFNEQYNGDKKTDCASELKEIVKPAVPALSVVPALSTDISVFTADANTDDAATVWFGGSAWRVIGYNYEGVANEKGALTLFASGNMDHAYFNDGNNGGRNKYDGSTLKAKVDDIVAGFSAVERSAISARTLNKGGFDKENTDWIAGDADLADQLLWPLSTTEAHLLDETLRKADPEHTSWASSSWWLRSPGGNENYAALVMGNSYVDFYGNFVNSAFGVRPAFWLDCESVLFVSRAEGGKKGEGALAEVGEYDGSEWKLTLLDADRDGFTASFDSASGDVWTIKYGGAKSGDNEYISAVIVDGDGAVTYYGRLCKAEAGSDKTATVDVSGKMNEGDKLYVFNEQYNGDKKTDCASRPTAITIPAPSSGTEATVDTDLVLYTYSKIYDGEPISVKAFHNRVNDDENVYFTDKVELAYYEVTPDGDVLLDEAPRDAGSYRAVGTLAAHGKYKAAEESIEFTIEKRPFTLDVQFKEAVSGGVEYYIKAVNVVERDLDHFPIVLVVDPVMGTSDEYVMTDGSLTAFVEYSPVSDAFSIEALGDVNYRFVECPNQGLKPDLANRRLYAGDCRAMLFDGSLEIEVSCDYPGEDDVYSFYLIEGKSVSVDIDGHADILCAGVSLVLAVLSDQAGLYNPATVIIPVFVEKGRVQVHPDFSGITPYNGLQQPVPYTLRYENENGGVSVQYDGFIRCEYYEKAAAGTNSEITLPKSVYSCEWSTNHNIWTAPKDAGEYYVLYRAVDTENFNAISVGESFVIDPAELEVVTYDAVKTYSGKPVTSVGEIKGLVNGETATLNLTGSQTDVGVSDNTYELVWDGTAKPENYYVDSVYIGMLKVMEAPLEVVTYDAIEFYSGKPLTSGGEIKGLVNGETVTFVTTGSQTDVGESDNTYTLTWDGTAKPDNYYVAFVYIGTLKVIEAPLEVVTYDAFEPYSGKPLTAGGELKGLVNGETVTFTVTGSQTDAGETYNTYTITWDGTAKPDNYYVSSKRLGILSVGKKALDVITYDDGKDYDGTPLTAGGEVTGLVNGETVTLNLTGSQTVAGESQNTYELIWDGTAKKDNYELIEFIGTLTVYKARPDFTFLDDFQDFPFIVGMTLGEIELPEGWSWLSAADEPLTEGEQVLELAFDLGDVNYITAVGIIDVTVMAPGYRFDAEAEEGYAYTIGDGEGLVLTVIQTNGEDKAFENFSRLLADGVELTKDADYTAEKGSVIITLPAETLEALGAGEHTVTAEFTNGEVSVTVTVNKVPAPADAFDLFLGVMLLAACGAVVTVFAAKKRA